MCQLLGQKLQRTGWTEPHALRITTAQFAFYDLFPIRVIRNGTERTTCQTCPAANTFITVNLQCPCVLIPFNGKRWAQMRTKGFITLLTRNQIKNEIVLFIYFRQGMSFMSDNMDSGF